MATFKSTLDFIPKKLQSDPLYIKICDILDNEIDTRLDEADDIFNKYRDIEALPEEGLKLLFDEFGFGYIADVVQNLSTDDLSKLTTFISFIHFFKGNRVGLELILDLLGFAYDLEEWWEKSPKATPETFTLDIDYNESENVDNFWTTIENLKAFIAQYVYPIMDPLQIIWSAIISKRDWVIGGFYDKIFEGETHGVYLLAHLGGVADKNVEGLISDSV